MSPLLTVLKVPHNAAPAELVDELATSSQPDQVEAIFDQESRRKDMQLQDSQRSQLDKFLDSAPSPLETDLNPDYGSEQLADESLRDWSLSVIGSQFDSCFEQFYPIRSRGSSSSIDPMECTNSHFYVARIGL
jgi:hypothetical protein